MKMHVSGLMIVLLFYRLSAAVESLIVTTGETLEIGGSNSYETVLISNGTIYLTNDTVITSSGDIQILSGATITWHYTTTNWSTNVYLDSPGGRSGSGASVIANSGTNAWHLTLNSTGSLIINGTIDLRGGAGQTHIGSADQGIYGGTFYNPAERSAHNGGDGGTSCGGHGGAGAHLFLISQAGCIRLTGANIILCGGNGETQEMEARQAAAEIITATPKTDRVQMEETAETLSAETAAMGATSLYGHYLSTSTDGHLTIFPDREELPAMRDTLTNPATDTGISAKKLFRGMEIPEVLE